MVRVIANKLFGNLVDMDYKRRAVVLSLLNAHVRHREQQGIFIGGGELPSPGTEGRNLKYAEIRHSQEFSAYSSTWFLARMDGDVDPIIDILECIVMVTKSVSKQIAVRSCNP
jgi:hypothetical protein